MRNSFKIFMMILLIPALGFATTHHAKNHKRSKHGHKAKAAAVAPEAPTQKMYQLIENTGTQIPACQNGTKQSPINIKDSSPTNLPPVQFNYAAAPLFLLNNGHALKILFPNDATDNYIVFNKQKYYLKEMTFHLPSEHLIDDLAYPMEVQFIHQGPNNKLLVISTFTSIGLNQRYFEIVLHNIPKETNKVFEIKRTRLNPMSLIPTDKTYFTYEGSLTSDPCTEGVTWLVFKNPLYVGPGQLQVLREKIADRNARNMQPLNGRVVSVVNNAGT